MSPARGVGCRAVPALVGIFLCVLSTAILAVQRGAPPAKPVLLAAFPTLPEQVAYRVVGRTLMLVDLTSRLIVDVMRFALPSEP